MLACALFLVARIAIAAPPCKPISGYDRYLSHARGIIVGDLHGTVQAPAFVATLVCNLSHSGHAVLLGLEYPTGEQHFLDEYLGAPTDDPHPALLATPFWTRPTQDGRTSAAMLELLSSIRQQIRSGTRVRVTAFDALTHIPTGASVFNARDEAMAEHLRHELSSLSAGEIPVIFAGNVHARKTRDLNPIGPSGTSVVLSPEMKNAEPLGYRLKDLGFLHLNIRFEGGSLWTCFSASDCTAHKIGEPGAAISSFSIEPSTDPAYDALYFVGALTASPPAASAN
jgi:hypothetical protein